MSDESEALAWARSHGIEGIGEVLYDKEQEFRELGISP